MIDINDLTISLMVLAGIRLTAFLIFTVLFFQHMRSRYLVLAVGWLIYMIGPIPDLFSDAYTNAVLHPLFGFSAAAGTYLLMISVLLYIREVALKILIPVIASVVAVLGIVLLIFPEISGNMAIFAQGTFLVSVLVLVIVNGIFLHNSKNSVSFIWLCATLVLGLLHAVGFNVFFGQAPLSLRFALTSMINVSILEYFIFFDWELSIKKLKESDKRYRFLFNTAPVALFEEDSSELRDYIARIEQNGKSNLDDYLAAHPEEIKNLPPKLRIIEANNKTISLFQANSRKDLIENVDGLFVPKTFVSLGKSVSALKDVNGYTSFETEIRTLKGETREVIISCYYPEKKNLDNKTIISMVDITEKNAAQKVIESSLREKEILLQEVHHRVKNNLAIISSILGLQLRNMEDIKMKELINSLANRISAMAIVHDQLYTCKDLDSIDVSDYILQLTDGLQIHFYDELKPVRIVLDIAPVKLCLNFLIPLGMLINEIVSNSFMHAFADILSPEIKISLDRNSENDYLLSIRDNGSGLSQDNPFKNSDSTGFIIIDALSNQIKADLHIKNNGGTEFRLLLPSDMVKT